MSNPQELKYTEDHEWVRVESGVATVGITAHAQDALGDIVFVQLPEVGGAVEAGESVSELESVKAVSDVYAPLSGTILEVNEGLDGAADLPHARDVSVALGAGVALPGRTVGELLAAACRDVQRNAGGLEIVPHWTLRP
mgnify:CR=1 FL=1